MNSKSIEKQYRKNYDKLKKIIEKRTLTKIDQLQLATDEIKISYGNRTVCHCENDFGMIYCSSVYENGKLKYVEGTNIRYIDTTFQDGAQEELQLLAQTNKSYISWREGQQKIHQKR